ncbi:hypothetical protein [Fodinibius salsisoli]|uniref:Uncharacterized protein n=1 Tax=Fodinibius salsisoli TaxID=2820877 RepID=A0ABT3PJR7_9BACT|nr:hypothetical protein [Fodinibius salsisoli]MCW9706172.1 hypothetical protein [Fodinibius salsisoli]
MDPAYFFPMRWMASYTGQSGLCDKVTNSRVQVANPSDGWVCHRWGVRAEFEIRMIKATKFSRSRRTANSAAGGENHLKLQFLIFRSN